MSETRPLLRPPTQPLQRRPTLSHRQRQHGPERSLIHAPQLRIHHERERLHNHLPLRLPAHNLVARIREVSIESGCLSEPAQMRQVDVLLLTIALDVARSNADPFVEIGGDGDAGFECDEACVDFADAGYERCG